MSSTPGQNGILYKVYKNCPRLVRRLWRLLKIAWRRDRMTNSWMLEDGCFIRRRRVECGGQHLFSSAITKDKGLLVHVGSYSRLNSMSTSVSKKEGYLVSPDVLNMNIPLSSPRSSGRGRITRAIPSSSAP